MGSTDDKCGRCGAPVDEIVVCYVRSCPIVTPSPLVAPADDRKRCWLAGLSSVPCDGRLVRVHLIPRQVVKREVRPSAVLDPRCWVWACGGPTGIGGHHGMLDYSRRLRIPRWRLPVALEDFAEETGLGWWLDREYGEKRPAGSVPLDPIGHMQARQVRR